MLNNLKLTSIKRSRILKKQMELNLKKIFQIKIFGKKMMKILKKVKFQYNQE